AVAQNLSVRAIVGIGEVPANRGIAVPAGYPSARLGAMSCGTVQCNARDVSDLSVSYAVQRFAWHASKLRWKSLLTGWSLVRIRPGKQNLNKPSNRRCFSALGCRRLPLPNADQHAARHHLATAPWN